MMATAGRQTRSNNVSGALWALLLLSVDITYTTIPNVDLMGSSGFFGVEIRVEATASSLRP